MLKILLLCSFVDTAVTTLIVSSSFHSTRRTDTKLHTHCLTKIVENLSHKPQISAVFLSSSAYPCFIYKVAETANVCIITKLVHSDKTDSADEHVNNYHRQTTTIQIHANDWYTQQCTSYSLI